MIHFITFVLVPLTAFLAAFKLIPIIIDLAIEKALVDIPQGRKQHKTPTPALGGIAIFIGMIISFFLWSDFAEMAELQYTIVAMIILFFIGLKDDLSEINANYKFLIQIGLAFIIALGGLRISSMHGLLGIGEIPPIFQYVLTIVFIVGLTNAYNMIDGIDGLAGGIALIASLSIGSALFILGDPVYGTLALALSGSLLGFLWFNFSPAKIFMGDTGSLSIGVLLGVLSIRFLESSHVLAGFTSFNSFGPVLIFSALMVPFIDVVQVIITRKLEGNPIFSPDRNHLHHLLLRAGLSHRRAALTLYALTLLCIGLTVSSLWLGLSMTLVFSILMCLIIAGVIALKIYIAPATPSSPKSNAISPTLAIQSIAKVG